MLRSARSAWTCEDEPWLQLGHAMARQGHGKGVVLLFPPGKGRPRHGVCSQPHLKG